MRRSSFAGAVAAVLLGAASASAQRSDCNAPAHDSIVTVDVPGNPFQALPTADGCWVFVSLPPGTRGQPSTIAVLGRRDGVTSVDHTFPIDGGATGMAITHDRKTLIVADGQRLAFVDVARALRRDSHPVLGYLDEPGTLGRVYVNVTPDDAFAFVADEQAQTVSVVNLAKARATKYNASAIVGKIPTGTLPIALTFSPDGKLIYLTSQWAPSSYGWPIACKKEGDAQVDTTPVNPQGTIHVVDVARAERDPASAIVASIPAGCSPVRLVLSPDGSRAYVTARNSNALLVFDREKLLSDSVHALIARVPLGTAPVGIAVTHDNRRVIVTNSNRFTGSADDHQTLTLIDADKVASGAAAILGSIPAGAFPREMRVTADGRTLVLTNFASKTVEIVDLTRIH